jgi:hypothetical protein
VIHHRQRLPLGFEAGDYLPRVHSRLDDLESHAAPHRLLLLSQVHHAEAALAKKLAQNVGTDSRAWFCRWACIDRGHQMPAVEQRIRLTVGSQQRLDAPSEKLVATARILNERVPGA